MKTLKYILLSLTACASLTASALEETLTFVRTDGSTVAFSTSGLSITLDETAHAMVTNEHTSTTIDLPDMDYMCLGEVEPHISGDVNGDSEVNIADVNTVIDLILSGNFGPLADVNGDGEVNIADINALIDIIVAG